MIALVEGLPMSITGQVIARQLVRCATSVGANWCGALRARSPADMLAKLGTVEEEADECCYWLELLVEGELVQREHVACHLRVADELTAMVVASRKTLRHKACRN